MWLEVSGGYDYSESLKGRQWLTVLWSRRKAIYLKLGTRRIFHRGLKLKLLRRLRMGNHHVSQEPHEIIRCVHGSGFARVFLWYQAIKLPRVTGS